MYRVGQKISQFIFAITFSTLDQLLYFLHIYTGKCATEGYTTIANRVW